MDEDPRYLQGIALFNAQYFFDAHDAWEDLWADTRDGDRLFYQSLIHAAVALYHWRNGNVAGASNVYGYFTRRSAGYPDVHHGLRFGVFRDRMAALFARLGSDPFDPALTPRMDVEGLDIPPPVTHEEM
ncbi:MAG: DUF309 domain-containing protein [Candidatus Brocadiae bacterium]|nr:DUF309 domain-containing protein [Candidatus Brocadiia bacterium]